MHPFHKRGNANTITDFHEYFQTLFKIGTANGAASNAYLGKLPNSILCPC